MTKNRQKQNNQAEFYLSKEDREKLPKSVFGLPDKRLFPILSEDDVASAAKLLGRAKITEEERELAKKRIKSIAKKKGYSIPDSWKNDDDTKMSLHDIAREHVSFASDTINIEDPVAWQGADGEIHVGIVTAKDGNTLQIELLSEDEYELVEDEGPTGLEFRVDQSVVKKLRV